MDHRVALTPGKPLGSLDQENPVLTKGDGKAAWHMPETMKVDGDIPPCTNKEWLTAYSPVQIRVRKLQQ